MFNFIKNLFCKKKIEVVEKCPDPENIQKDKLTYGCPKDKKDDRDYIKKVDLEKAFASMGEDTMEEFSLKSYLPAIRNQGSTGSCTGFSTAYAAYIIVKRMLDNDKMVASSNGKLPPFSPLWIYYNARKYDGMEKKDTGAYMRSAMRALKESGVIQEGNYSFNKYTPLSTPPVFDKTVKAYKLHNYMRIDSDKDTVDTLKSVLAYEMLPVVAGISIYEDSYTTSGVFNPLKDWQLEDRCYLGGHAICITGYKKIKGKLYFEFANSWGTNWGDKGFGYIREDLITNETYTNDLWTFDKEYF